MFKTLQPHHQDERFAKTAIPCRRRVFFDSEGKNRPNTTAYGQLDLSNAFSNFKTIDFVENDLRQTFRK